MSHTQKGRPRELERSALDDAITSICRKRSSQEKIIISVNEIAAELEAEFGIDVSPVTVRRRGVHKSGYYEKKYPDACSYNHMGDTRLRGLIVEREKFLSEVES